MKICWTTDWNRRTVCPSVFLILSTGVQGHRKRKLGKSVCYHYQSFLIIFVKELEGRIGGKSCKNEKMAPTLTNYENIAVTLCLMRIVILRRRLRDRARVRRRATRSWLPRRKQRSAYNTRLRELHTEDPNEFWNYFRMDKTTFKMLLENVRPLIETGYQTSGSHICSRTTCSDITFSGFWFSLSRLFITMYFCFVNIISSFQNSVLIGWFPSKSIKVWRKIGWSSIPSKF